MLVGVGRIVLDYYGNQKATKKNQELEQFCADIRKKFNISILEIADFDDPERCVLGFALAIPETWKVASAQALVDKVTRLIDETAFARVTMEDCEILEHGGGGVYEGP